MMDQQAGHSISPSTDLCLPLRLLHQLLYQQSRFALVCELTHMKLVQSIDCLRLNSRDSESSTSGSSVLAILAAVAFQPQRHHVPCNLVQLVDTSRMGSLSQLQMPGSLLWHTAHGFQTASNRLERLPVYQRTTHPACTCAIDLEMSFSARGAAHRASSLLELLVFCFSEGCAEKELFFCPNMPTEDLASSISETRIISCLSTFHVSL